MVTDDDEGVGCDSLSVNSYAVSNESGFTRRVEDILLTEARYLFLSFIVCHLFFFFELLRQE